MITVIMGKNTGFDEEMKWMNRALSAQMDYPDSYQRLLFAWKPSWGGSYDAMLTIGLQALTTKAFDTGTPEFLIDAIESVENDMKIEKINPTEITRRFHLFAAIENLFDGYLAEPTRASLRNWDLTRYAAYSWRFGNHDQCRSILARIKGSIDPEQFKSIAHEILGNAQK
jgi:hypothetical protein